jgi:hypothetical protein
MQLLTFAFYEIVDEYNSANAFHWVYKNCTRHRNGRKQKIQNRRLVEISSQFPEVFSIPSSAVPDEEVSERNFSFCLNGVGGGGRG